MALNGLRKVLNKAKKHSMQKSVEEAVKVNTDDLLRVFKRQAGAGFSGDGSYTTLYGKPFYEWSTMLKKAKTGSPPYGQITGWITNFHTGRFYASLQVEIKGDTFRIYSNHELYDKVLARSGDEWFTINPVSGELFNEEEIEPEVREDFTSIFYE